MEETYAGGTESRGSRMRQCLRSPDVHLSHESPNVSSCNVVTSSSASCWVVAGSSALELTQSGQESGYFSSSLKGGRVFDAATEARGERATWGDGAGFCPPPGAPGGERSRRQRRCTEAQPECQAVGSPTTSERTGTGAGQGASRRRKPRLARTLRVLFVSLNRCR